MSYNLRSAFSSFFLTVFICTTLHAAELPGTAGKDIKSSEKYVTVETIRQSLPVSPIVAGFDIDDTVVFSSPGFYFGEHNNEGPGGKNRYGDDYLHNPQFWKDINQKHDIYSMKKVSGDELVQMHKGRGDAIVFITKRFCYDDDSGVIKKRLNAMFNVQSKVYCTNDQSKTPFITDTGVDIYYGDSDSDIEYAVAVKKKAVRAIRVERSGLSTNKTGYNPGKYGEEVLAHSEN
jgi:acid phosphatase (class B)